jgi:hypothetical protein
MKHTILSLGTAALLTVLACSSDFGHIGANKHLFVHVTNGKLGAFAQHDRLALTVAAPTPDTTYTVHIEARNPDESVNTDFNGYVRVSVKPGTVVSSDPQDNIRNVQLVNGVSPTDIVVPTVGAFGDTHIWAEDLGYQPADPARNPPPQCSDGIDNNQNGVIDYPADPGCFSPIDDTEDLGTYATGASETIYFQLPRIHYVRGLDPAENGNGNKCIYPNQQVSIDTGWRGGTSYDFSTIVVNVAASGFYAQDIQNDYSANGQTAPGYGGIYAYTYSSPPFIRVCDRLQLFNGQSADFYGFTELNYPTWQIEPWDPSQRPCLVPEPTVLLPNRPTGGSDLADNNRLWQLESTLVRVIATGTVGVRVAAHLGPDFVPRVADAMCATPPCYAPSPNASNCDFNRNGKVDYTDTYEGACGVTCNGSSAAGPSDIECSEYSAYASQGDFELIVTDSTAKTSAQRLQANASAATLFNPVAQRGLPIKSFTGTLSYFSGGTQFTANARCQDDIVVDLNAQPLTSDVACVHPRTALDNQQTAQ